jgi:hypothetical protein
MPFKGMEGRFEIQDLHRGSLYNYMQIPNRDELVTSKFIKHWQTFHSVFEGLAHYSMAFSFCRR